MGGRSVIPALLALTALLGIEAAANADPADFSLRGYRGSASRISSRIYGYLPSFDRDASWEDQAMRQLRRVSRRLAQLQRVPLRKSSSGSRGRPLGPRETGPAEPDLTSDPLAGYGGGTGEYDAEFGILLERTKDRPTEEDLLLELEGVPDAAIKLTDYLIQFADGALTLTVNLRRLLGLDPTFDLKKLLAGREISLSQKVKALRKERVATSTPKTQEQNDRVTVRKVVRSVVKISLGVIIGILLWFVVRLI